MNNVWIGAVVSVVLIGLVALAVGGAKGAAWGWAAFSAGLLLVGLHHLRNLAKLMEWARAPAGQPLPQGSGLWDWVYAALHRRAKAASDQSQELTAALERFVLAAHAMPDGVMILTGHNTIEWINRAAEDHFGLDRRRDHGFPVTNLVRQPDFVAYVEAGESAEPLILRSLRRVGQTLSVQVVPFAAEHRLVLSRDLTQLERLETMRRDFIANVSHELKTPLTVVSGFLETLRDHHGEMPPEEAARFLQLSHDQARRMQRLVDDLLTLSRLETGSPPPPDEEVEVSALLAEVTRDAQALSGGRHSIELAAGQSAVLRGSAVELASAFGNLTSNAVRYTPAGGRIRIVWQLTREGGAVFSVEDNGIGIEARHIPRLTERFYRVDRGRSRETGGTGLGLAIVKHVLQRHDAALEIDSAPGRGSRFTVRFPPRRLRRADPGSESARS